MKHRDLKTSGDNVVPSSPLDMDWAFCRYQRLLGAIPVAACLDVGTMFRRYLVHKDVRRALREVEDIVIPIRLSRKRPCGRLWARRKARQYLKTIIPWQTTTATKGG